MLIWESAQYKGIVLTFVFRILYILTALGTDDSKYILVSGVPLPEHMGRIA